MKFKPSSIAEINDTMNAAHAAFQLYRKTAPEQRAGFLEIIATEIENIGDALIHKAMEETNLPAPRLMGERTRTLMQLRMFAALIREGSWVEASVDTALPDRTPIPKPDLRKMLIPMGPIVVFGASNFPFAYSTAGGDTASALAAGCPVIVKAHPAHGETSQMVFEAVKRAIEVCNMPAAVFAHVFGENETGKALVQHPFTAGVGFTGSFTGGTALVEYARQRERPIPVFSEMGSVNPVILLPDTLSKNTASLAKAFATSVTLSMGQFCTNPGILLGIAGGDLDAFLDRLSSEVSEVKPAPMLHPGISRSYVERKKRALVQSGVHHSETEVVEELEALPVIASVSGKDFLENEILREEVFGPYSLVVKCRDIEELKDAWRSLSGQLTTTLTGTEKDFSEYPDLLDLGREIAGRLIFNGVPTGVEVCPSMVHGGPFPATTDSRFTSVGSTSIKRWVRPVCYQDCPEYLLPEELKSSNPRRIWRLLNNELSKEPA